MSNRKSATASKLPAINRKRAGASNRGRRPKAATRAQQKKQSVIRSRKESPLRLVATGSTEAPNEVRDERQPEAPVVETPARAAESEAGLQASLQNDSGQNTGNPSEAFDYTLPFANMLAYQAKLLEVVQSNMQFGLEFVQRLATIRSPFSLGALIGEFTRRRIAMTAKHSQELVALSLRRVDPSQSLTA